MPHLKPTLSSMYRLAGYSLPRDEKSHCPSQTDLGGLKVMLIFRTRLTPVRDWVPQGLAQSSFTHLQGQRSPTPPHSQGKRFSLVPHGCFCRRSSWMSPPSPFLLEEQLQPPVLFTCLVLQHPAQDTPSEPHPAISVGFTLLRWVPAGAEPGAPHPSFPPRRHRLGISITLTTGLEVIKSWGKWQWPGHKRAVPSAPSPGSEDCPSQRWWQSSWTLSPNIPSSPSSKCPHPRVL